MANITPGTKSPQAARLAALHQRMSRGGYDRGDLQAIETAAVLLERMAAGTEISVETIVSRTTGAGMVDVAWGGHVSQLSVGKAREIAWLLIEAASVAEQDAMVTRFLKQEIGVDAERAALLLQHFRAYRDADPMASLASHASADAAKTDKAPS